MILYISHGVTDRTGPFITEVHLALFNREIGFNLFLDIVKIKIDPIKKAHVKWHLSIEKLPLAITDVPTIHSYFMTLQWSL